MPGHSTRPPSRRDLIEAAEQNAHVKELWGDIRHAAEPALRELEPKRRTLKEAAEGFSKAVERSQEWDRGPGAELREELPQRGPAPSPERNASGQRRQVGPHYLPRDFRAVQTLIDLLPGVVSLDSVEYFKDLLGALCTPDNPEMQYENIEDLTDCVRQVSEDASGQLGSARAGATDTKGRDEAEGDTAVPAEAQDHSGCRLTWDGDEPLYGRVRFKGRPQSITLLQVLSTQHRASERELCKALSPALSWNDPTEREKAINTLRAAMTRLRKDTEKSWGWDRTALPQRDKEGCYPLNLLPSIVDPWRDDRAITKSKKSEARRYSDMGNLPK